MRGMLSEEIKQKSQELLGYEITQEELRLMPYVLYCVLNDQDVSPRHINAEERNILMEWQKKGFISSHSSDLRVRKDFYDMANELLWIGYIVAVERDKD